MTKEKLKQAVCEIKQHRNDIISKLVQFSKNDSLLFWDTDAAVAQKQEQLWAPVLQWANRMLNSKYAATDKLEVSEPDGNSLSGLRSFMEGMSDEELAAFYLASMNMKSELLAAALVKGHINADEAYKAAYLEELSQADRWGYDEIAEERRQNMRSELSDIEDFLKK